MPFSQIGNKTSTFIKILFEKEKQKKNYNKQTKKTRNIYAILDQNTQNIFCIIYNKNILN